MQHFRETLQDLIDEAGSQSELAVNLGITQQNVSRLMTRGKRVSPELAVKIELMTGGKIKRSDLRPDLFNERAA
jgi:DNA-binding transcriptional regulator YdaS (Cro superfamily)